jgi:hypothetical protein
MTMELREFQTHWLCRLIDGATSHGMLHPQTSEKTRINSFLGLHSNFRPADALITDQPGLHSQTLSKKKTKHLAGHQ